MLRVMFVMPSMSHGGAERHAVALMNRLAERGHECHAVSIKDGTIQRDRLRLRGHGSVRCLDARRYFDLRALADLAAHLRRASPAVVVAANSYALMYASLALRHARLRVPLVVTYHSTRLLNAKERLQMALYRLFFWTADCSVFVCERQRRHWRRRAVFSRRNEVIYNGVDTDEFRDRWSAHEREALRGTLGFRETDYVIGLSALLRPEKNPVQLVEAVAALRLQGLPARALMIGDGEMRAQVEARARALGVGNDVVITGLQRDVRPFIAACDVVTLCSFTEAFSLAALEAMALGRAVVHPDVGGAREMILPGQNGFLFPVGDTSVLVERLALLAQRAVSRRMGACAREVVERRFSDRVMADRYERLLGALCRPRAGAGKPLPAGRTVHSDHDAGA